LSRSAIADAGPLIALARLGRLSLLTAVFDEVLVPEAVAHECWANAALPGAAELLAAAKKNLFRVVPVEARELKVSRSLGPGELAVLQLALQNRAILLMDDRQGRLAARRLGLGVVGTGGLLIEAKRRGAIGEIRPVLDQLTCNGYRLADQLAAELLRLAGED